MQNYTRQELKQRYEKLPEVLKDAMFSADIATKIFAIGKKHGLTIEKTGFMAEETGYLILGLTRPAELVNILTEALEVKEEQAKEIANDLNHQIFYPLREALKNAHQIEIGEGALQKNITTLKKPEPPVSSLPGQKINTSPFLAPRPPSVPLSSIITIPVSKTPPPVAPPPLPPKPPATLEQPQSAALQPQPPLVVAPTPPKPTPPPVIISVPPPILLKPLAEKTSAIPPTSPPLQPQLQPPAEKPPAPPAIPQPPAPAAEQKPAPAPPESIDLRAQQKIKLPDLPPPKPESMGGSIFGAPKIVNLLPKPPAPPEPPLSPAEKTITPIPKPRRENDPYREPVE